MDYMIDLNPQKERMYKTPQKIAQNMANQFFKQLQGKTFNRPVTPASHPMKLAEYIKKNNMKKKSLDHHQKERFLSEDDWTKALIQKRQNLNQILKKICKKLQRSQLTFQKINDLNKLHEYETKLLQVCKLLVDFHLPTQTLDKQELINTAPSPKYNHQNAKPQLSQEKSHHKIDIEQIRSRLKIPKDYHHYYPLLTTEDDNNQKYLIDKSKLSTSIFLTQEDKKSYLNGSKKQGVSKQITKETLKDDPLIRTLNNLNAQLMQNNQNLIDQNYENLQKSFQLNINSKTQNKKQALMGSKNHLKSPRFFIERLKSNNFSQTTQRKHKQ